jgi:hypothetical protein
MKVRRIAEVDMYTHFLKTSESIDGYSQPRNTTERYVVTFIVNV